MTKTVFGSLAQAIDRVGSNDFYPAMAQYLRSCMDYDNVIVIIFVGTNVPDVLYKSVRGPDVFRNVAEQYLPGAYLLDPVYYFHLRRGAPGLYRLLDIAPDQFRRSRYFKWYYGRIGITDEISILLPIGDNTTITISLGKDSSSGQLFSSKAEGQLRQHEPVVMSLLRGHFSASQVRTAVGRKPRSVIDNLIVTMKSHHDVGLSRRQAEVALLILQGHSSPSIGLHLGVSPQTVKVFRKQLYARCGISSQAELFGLLMPILGNG
ncbi:helix-turn-helix transcriptional regulator [Mesorhizobium sp. BR1-1-9]|uniref:helix-turn-helix transcriptional regulator n=1 Tax=Mesorhizobium sp. BR1-1-9 TaxID=2876646 RepID=UPI001CD1864B|nr:helix-turn-helix transcriptional regulator [Mesorhizobium sp. BR1-1-9]MBZ9870492.1 helix-turn-helix transcriptional regulator [Mesorhizobium sp. BR1-1-9]